VKTRKQGKGPLRRAEEGEEKTWVESEKTRKEGKIEEKNTTYATETWATEWELRRTRGNFKREE